MSGVWMLFKPSLVLGFSSSLTINVVDRQPPELRPTATPIAHASRDLGPEK